MSVARDAGGVLIVRPSSLGDIVYALAVVADIRRERPALAVDWVAEQGFMPLIKLCPDVRRVIAFGLRGWRKAPLAASTWRAIRTFAADLRRTRYDAILDLQEQVKGALIARGARGTRHGFDRASIREPLAALFDNVHHRVPRGHRRRGPTSWRCMERAATTSCGRRTAGAACSRPSTARVSRASCRGEVRPRKRAAIGSRRVSRMR